MDENRYMRKMLMFAYKGTQYDGFQVQPKKLTVQSAMQDAIKQVVKMDVKIVASGRTDAKVHAKAQVAHLDLNVKIDSARLKRAINRALPKDIYIYEIVDVEDSFHARFSAKGKTYRYFIQMNSYDPFIADTVYMHPRALDVVAMAQTLQLFVGTHDYRSFTTQKDKDNCVRTIYSATITQSQQTLCIEIKGNGFLRHMVRLIVGAIIRVGDQRLNSDVVASLLDSKGLLPCIYKAKPQGLHLWCVDYE